MQKSEGLGTLGFLFWIPLWETFKTFKFRRWIFRQYNLWVCWEVSIIRQLSFEIYSKWMFIVCKLRRVKSLTMGYKIFFEQYLQDTFRDTLLDFHLDVHRLLFENCQEFEDGYCQLTASIHLRSVCCQTMDFIWLDIHLLFK